MSDVKQNHYYRCDFLGGTVKIIRVDKRKNQCVVEYRNKRVQVPLDSINQEVKVKEKKNVNYYHVDSGNNESNVFDCHGLKLDEFEAKIERILSDILINKFDEAIIIHGHGDGILKNWLRNYLNKSPDFRFEIPLGKDYATKILMR